MIISRTHNRMQRNFLLFYLKNQCYFNVGLLQMLSRAHNTIVRYIILSTLHYMYIQMQVMTKYW